MNWLLGCTDGMTAAEAARILTGWALLLCGAGMAGVLLRETWEAWKDERRDAQRSTGENENEEG
jgi:hypothetical protein